jgi:hypothetical protein
MFNYKGIIRHLTPVQAILSPTLIQIGRPCPFNLSLSWPDLTVVNYVQPPLSTQVLIGTLVTRGMAGHKLRVAHLVSLLLLSPLTAVTPSILLTHTNQSGVEDLSVRFPASNYLGHLTEAGYNWLYMQYQDHSWVRRVRVTNADYGVMVRGGWVDSVF